MRTLWVVIRLELTLLLRGRIIWFMALIMALIGVWVAIGIKGLPWGVWSNFVLSGSFLVSLILTFSTGGQIQRDRERHLDGVVWSTPVAASIYIWGKYLGALIVVLGLTIISMLASILADQFYNISDSVPVFGAALFPPLGALPYLVFWCWFTIIPTIFGAALALALTTFTRGQRIVAYMLALLLWISSFIGSLSGLIDITASSFFLRQGSPHLNSVFQLATKGGLSYDQAKHVMDLVRADIPPTFLPSVFLWNRLFFFCLAILLIWITVYIVSYRRQRAA